MRTALVLYLVYMLCVGSPVCAREPKPTAREQTQGIQPGKIVEIKFQDKHKIRGRLVAVKEQDFVVQVAQKQQVQEKVVSFAAVRSVKEVAELHSGRTATWIVLGAVATVAIVVLIAVLHFVPNS
jgi:hypothetical protein